MEKREKKKKKEGKEVPSLSHSLSYGKGGEKRKKIKGGRKKIDFKFRCLRSINIRGTKEGKRKKRIKRKKEKGGGRKKEGETTLHSAGSLLCAERHGEERGGKGKRNFLYFGAISSPPEINKLEGRERGKKKERGGRGGKKKGRNQSQLIFLFAFRSEGGKGRGKKKKGKGKRKSLS